VGAARACLAPSAAWQPFPTVAYTTRQNGGRLDVYVFEWASAPEDRFDVDDMALRVEAPGPPITARAVDSAHVALLWRSVPGAVAYRVLRDGLEVARTPATGFTDALLWPQTAYNYRIEPLSADGSTIPALAVTATTAPLPRVRLSQPVSVEQHLESPCPCGRHAVPGERKPRRELAGRLRRQAEHDVGAWGVAVAEAHPSDKLYTVPCTLYSCTLDAFGPFRIPLTAKSDPAGDGHLVVHDPVARREWRMWEAGYDATQDAWTSSAGAAVSLDGDGIAPAGRASGNAANFPLLGGLIRPEEIAQGRIEHALVFGQPGIGAGRPVCPATANVSTTSDPLALREGTLLQLDPAVDVDALGLRKGRRSSRGRCRSRDVPPRQLGLARDLRREPRRTRLRRVGEGRPRRRLDRLLERFSVVGDARDPRAGLLTVGRRAPHSADGRISGRPSCPSP